MHIQGFYDPCIPTFLHIILITFSSGMLNIIGESLSPYCKQVQNLKASDTSPCINFIKFEEIPSSVMIFLRQLQSIEMAILKSTKKACTS